MCNKCNFVLCIMKLIDVLCTIFSFSNYYRKRRLLGKGQFLFFLCASADLVSAPECRVTTASPHVFFVLLCLDASSDMITSCQVPIPCSLM
jgi:hypothetical protein